MVVLDWTEDDRIALPEFIELDGDVVFFIKIRPNQAKLDELSCGIVFLVALGRYLGSLGEERRPERPFPATGGGGGVKLLNDPQGLKDDEVVVPKFWIIQITPCNFWKLHFKPWTKTFKSLQNKPFDFNFLKLFYLIILNSKNSF